MGVEGKDRAKVLEAGAASLSNQLGQAVLRLRKGYDCRSSGVPFGLRFDCSWAMVSQGGKHEFALLTEWPLMRLQRTFAAWRERPPWVEPV
jgi:hypothetical protein